MLNVQSDVHVIIFQFAIGYFAVMATRGSEHARCMNHLHCICICNILCNQVQLEVVYLAVKYTWPCKDWLQIGRRRTCGTNVDLYQGRTIPISFHSDKDESHSGFWLHFQCINIFYLLSKYELPTGLKRPP